MRLICLLTRFVVCKILKYAPHTFQERTQMCLLKTGKQLGQVSPCPSSLPDKYPVSRLLKHLDEILATHRSQAPASIFSPTPPCKAENDGPGVILVVELDEARPLVYAGEEINTEDELQVLYYCSGFTFKQSIRQLLSIKENICAERHRKSYALQDAKK